MDDQNELDQRYPRFRDARALLERRGILPEGEMHTTRQLTRELARRGWRWKLDIDAAEASKAYTPSGTESLTMVATGANQLVTLTIVLADAIRFDEEHGLSLVGPYFADIVIRAPDGRIVAVAEVKNREQLTGGIATMFRRDVIADGRWDPRIPFFLLVSQDVGFLWDHLTGSLAFAPPSKEFSMRPVVAHYLSWFDAEERLGSRELELVVAQWLADIAEGHQERPIVADQSFAGTQFLEAIQGASVSTDVDVAV